MVKQLLALVLPTVALFTLLFHLLLSILGSMWFLVVLDAISVCVIVWLLLIIISILFGDYI